MKKVLCGVLVTLLMSSCTYIDNWMLGEDNTPKPAALPHIAQPFPMGVAWRASVRGLPRKPFYSRWVDYFMSGKRRYETGYFKLAPVYRNGVVYAASSDGQVEALHAQKGDVLWQNTMSSGLASGPYVGRDHIAIGGGDASVFLLRKKDGLVVWHKPVSNTVLAPPVISHGRVFAKTIDGHVYAFDEASGQELWQYHHPTPNLILRAQSTPEVVDNMVIVGFADGKIDGLSADNGSILWQRSITYARGSSDVDRMVDIDATPIVRNDVIYVVTYQGYVVALSLNSGRFLWRHALSSYRNMALGRRYLYVTDNNSDIWAFDPRNGTVVWRQQKLHNRDLTAPVLTRQGLVFADKLGFLHLVSSQTGEILGRLDLTDELINARPAAYRNQLYVQTAKSQLYDVEVGRK